MAYIVENWLEILGLVSGLLCVWLLIRENILTFPLGLIYSVITVVVVARAGLYADVLLNLYYVLMNAYGWYFWTYGGAKRRSNEVLAVTRIPGNQTLWLAGLLLLGTFTMGWYFAAHTDAALPYPDSFTTVASFIAMWMSARKYLESWILWFVIDVIQVGLYLVKGIHEYALLYLVYLGMAVAGWFSWRRHLTYAVSQ
ncbi:MAG: nicotinamide riboside transporter PnuC [Pseudomonadota bacterium]